MNLKLIKGILCPQKPISLVHHSLHFFLAFVHSYFVGGTKMQGKDEREENMDAINGIGMYPLN